MEGPESLRKRAQAYIEKQEEASKQHYSNICNMVFVRLQKAADSGHFRHTLDTNGDLLLNEKELDYIAHNFRNLGYKVDVYLKCIIISWE
jgi:hypothetical protein